MALEIWRSARSPAQKERDLLSHFLSCVRDYSGAEYLVPFRFVPESANRTSHYLVHCSRHPLAFRLMKDVMGSLRTDGEPGQFSHLGHSDLGDQISLFAPRQKRRQRRRSSLSCPTARDPSACSRNSGWNDEPTCSVVDYRAILLGLETDGRIQVLQEDGQHRRRLMRGDGTRANRHLRRECWSGVALHSLPNAIRVCRSGERHDLESAHKIRILQACSEACAGGPDPDALGRRSRASRCIGQGAALVCTDIS